MYLIASPTVVILSPASSSGIEISNFFSNSMIRSTISSESAPRSFWKLAFSVISAAGTPSLSTMISFTSCAMLALTLNFLVNIYF